MKYFMLIGVFVMGQYSAARMCGNYNIEAPGPTPLAAPVKPVPANCERTDADGTKTIDQACLADNQQKDRDYQYQSGCFSQANQVQQGIIQAADADAERQKQAAAARLAQESSAKAAAEAAQKQNEKGSQIYQLASMGASIAAGYYFSLWASTSCGPYTPGYCNPGLLAKAIAFTVMSQLGSKQAKSHDSVAQASCVAASKLASEGSSCGAPPPAYNPQSFPETASIGSVFDKNGKCIGSAADCQAIVGSLPQGVSIKDGLKGLDSFASGGSKIFTVDKDGNIITKDGKKYSAADFASEKAMMAAGMSAADAKELFAALNKTGANFDAKKALAKENAKDASGAFGDAGGAGGLKGNSSTLNGAADLDKNIGGGKRDPASAEGLAKEFNGDMIGVAGDDIFRMMNRRYKLKAAQDNFIAP